MKQMPLILGDHQHYWEDDLLYAMVLMMPLFLVNYYWFYKLMCKAIRIYNKSKILEKTM